VIQLFVGTPGASKTYSALRVEIVPELVYGQRLIITNAPLFVDKLNAWLAVNHPEWKDDINLRVRLITEEQTKEFYRYRGMVDDIGHVTREDALRGKHLPYGENRGPGVLYVIDEAHIPFDSREWATTGPELTYYNSQHRKLNDELVFITQFEKLVDVRVRGFVQQFVYLNNNGMEKFWSFFQKPNTFTMEIHRKPPSIGSPPPMEKRTFRMDYTLANCYDTSAGVGITGRKMPETRRKKGLNMWWLTVPALAVVYLLSQAPNWVTKGAHALTGMGDKVVDKAQASMKEKTGVQRGPAPLPPAVPGETQRPAINNSPGVPPGEPVYATGFLVGPTGIIVLLSDGSRKATAPGVYETIRIHGTVYEFKPKPRPVQPAYVPPGEPPKEKEEKPKKELTPEENAPSVTVHEKQNNGEGEPPSAHPPGGGTSPRLVVTRQPGSPSPSRYPAQGVRKP